MSTTIRLGDWLRFQTEDVTVEGTVVTHDKHTPPHWLWVGNYIVADSEGQPVAVEIHEHKPARPELDRVARAIAEADGNSQPGCVYASLARAAIEAMAS